MFGLSSHFQNVPFGIFHAYGKRELDGAGSALIDSAWFIVQLPASSLIVTAANCPNVSIFVVEGIESYFSVSPLIQELSETEIEALRDF